MSLFPESTVQDWKTYRESEVRSGRKRGPDNTPAVAHPLDERADHNGVRADHQKQAYPARDQCQIRADPQVDVFIARRALSIDP